MNSTDASDYSPLAYGTGLAIGLMLILGLPRESGEKAATPPAAEPDAIRFDRAPVGLRSYPGTRSNQPRPSGAVRIGSRP